MFHDCWVVRAVPLTKSLKILKKIDMFMDLNLRIRAVVCDHYSSNALAFTKLLNNNCKDCN